MNAKERILALVKDEYMQHIPAFVRKHATERTVEKIEKEHPELYAAFTQSEEPSPAIQQEMATLINGIFQERMEKHHLFGKKGA